MNTSSPVPSLAKGQAKRLVREAVQAEIELLDDLLLRRRKCGKKPASRQQWIRAAIESCTIPNAGKMLGIERHGPSKKPLVKVFFLNAAVYHQDRLQVWMVEVDSRRFSIDESGLAAYVSRHCIARVFQRSGLSGADAVMAEIGEAVKKVLLLPLRIGEFAVNTATGRFFYVVGEGTHSQHELTFTTYVDNAKLRPDQLNGNPQADDDRSE